MTGLLEYQRWTSESQVRGSSILCLFKIFIIMNLIIVESPTKARTLSRFLGSGYLVEATMGHIKDLPKNKLGIDVENNFKPDYQVVEKRAEIIKRIQSASVKSDEIFIASDPDREGEAIAQHVKEILAEQSSPVTKNLRRIVFHEITKNAVDEALKNPRDIDVNLVDAQTARRVLDRLVGYKLSPLLWKKVRLGLSAGRVQTVCVRLIVEKEREIKAFKSEEYWDIYVNVGKTESANKKESGEFIIQLIKINDKKAAIGNKKDADRIVTELKISDYKVSNIVKREVVKHSYPPFTTSTMSQAASRIFGWSSKKTMSVAQTLYEEGLITYHRTDSTYVASEAVFKVRDFIKSKYGTKYLPEKPKFYKTTSKVAQEAHEAIRPTDIGSKINVQNSKYQKEADTLYGLIWNRFVACQMSASVYDETTIDVTAGIYLLRATGAVMKFDGWKILYPKSQGNNGNGDVILPNVEKNEVLRLIKVTPEQKFTQPPARYTEATLIKTLEKLGIGRPSTYAPTINTIQVRNYVEKNEGKFTPTSVGIAVNDFLITNFPDVFEYQFTAGLEEGLDRVANGELKWEGLISDFFKPFEEKINGVEKNSKRVVIEAENTGEKCSECKEGEVIIRLGRFGKFLSCSKFPECKYTAKYIQKVGKKCPECKTGDVIIKNTKRGRKFFGCSRYPKCKWASWRKPS